mgnify:CR=1 FL=1|tara:strand:+ start:13141 stop:14889 length:1749 start_codon:yes stop_codon:yes gene_type:complete
MAINIISANIIENTATPCDFVDVQVTTESVIYGWVSSDSVTPNLVGALTFIVSCPRGIPFRVGLIESEFASERISLSEFLGSLYFFFRKLYSSDINIHTEPNLDGTSTIETTIFWTQEPSLPYLSLLYEYSIDNVTWQSSNLFLSVSAGPQTIYFRDNKGCQVQKDITIEGGVSNPYEKIFNISNVNSMTFAKDEIWDSLQGGIYKTKENTLAMTGRENWLARETVIYRVNDSIKIQFKSNYPTHEVKVQDCKGEDTDLVVGVIRKSDNLDLFESLDCVLFHTSSGLLGMYFTSGNFYDSSGATLGTFQLQGNLPDSGKIGAIMEIPSYGSQEVVDVVYDSTVNKRVLIFNTPSVTVGSTIMKSLYNLLDYNIYEFTLDFEDIVIPAGLMSQVRIKIKAEDTVNVEEENYYSEYIDIISDNDWVDLDGDNSMVSIDYYNKNNQDIFYIYGIKHFFRTGIKSIEEIIIDESESSIGDKTTSLITSSVNEGISIVFEEVNYREMIKIVLAISSENLFVNGKGYVKNENVKVEKIKNTSSYSIECSLISSGQSFNININGAVGGDGNPIYLPKLIDVGTENYLKI